MRFEREIGFSLKFNYVYAILKKREKLNFLKNSILRSKKTKTFFFS